MNHRGRIALCLFSLLAAACPRREIPPKTPISAVVGGSLGAGITVLTEADRLASPAENERTRFLSGWIPQRRQGSWVYRMAKEARIEVVLLGRERELLLRLAPESPRGGRLAVDAGAERHTRLGSVTVADLIRVPLPPDLGAGRLTLRFTLESGEPPLVQGGALRPSARPGHATLEGDNLRMGGVARAELLFPCSVPCTLSSEFAFSGESRGSTVSVGLSREEGMREEMQLNPGEWGTRHGFDIHLPEVKPETAPSSVLAGAVFAFEGPPDAEVLFTDLRFSSHAVATPRVGVEVPAQRRPRLVVVYVMDALRADFVGHLGGDPAATPTWDRLASEGWAATRHHSVAPNTMPSSKALFTGRLFAVGGGSKLKPHDGPTLAETFREAGYRTGLFSGNVHLSDAYGMDRGFDVAPKELLLDRHYAAGSTPHNDNAERVQAAALAWLASLPADADAFLYLHTIHPHNPYAPPRRERERFAPRAAGLGIDGETQTLFRIKQGHRDVSAAEIESLRGLYRGSLAYNDRVLTEFLAELARRFSPADTVLALTSDHGEELFDHGGVLHGYTLYEELLRIPLVLWGPGRFAPRRIENATDTLDLHRALSSIAGGSPATSAATRSELQFAAASSLRGGIYSVQNERWKIVWAPRVPPGWGMGDGIGRGRDAELWFRLDRDPREVDNRVGDDEWEAEWLRGQLFAWIARETGENRGSANDSPESEPEMDPETVKGLKALGYVQ